MKQKSREKKIDEIWASQDEAYNLMRAYDDIPHNYGEYSLFQVEGEFIDIIGENHDGNCGIIGQNTKRMFADCAKTAEEGNGGTSAR